MDAKRVLALDVMVNVHGILRVYMGFFHKPPGLIGTNRDGSHVEWAVLRTNLFESRAVARVTYRQERKKRKEGGANQN